MKFKRLAKRLGAKSKEPGSLISRMHELKGMPKHKERKPKPQGKGIVKALGQKGTTGNFAKIEASKGKGAAIGALQNKLAARRGKLAPFHRKSELDFKKHKNPSTEDGLKEPHEKHMKMACKKHKKMNCKEC